MDLPSLVECARAAVESLLCQPLGHTAVFQVIPLRILGSWVWG